MNRSIEILTSLMVFMIRGIIGGGILGVMVLFILLIAESGLLASIPAAIIVGIATFGYIESILRFPEDIEDFDS